MRIDSEEHTMQTTIKMPAHPVRFTRTPRDVDADYMDCSWGAIFDMAAEDIHLDHYVYSGTRANALQSMDRIARYAPTMTLRRAAKGW